MLRVISELRPAWVVGENVAGIVNLALDQVLSDLEAKGYTCQAYIVPACAVDAPHRRARVAIVAHANQQGLQGRDGGNLPKCTGEQPTGKGSAPVDNTSGGRCDRNDRREYAPLTEDGSVWLPQSGLGGMVDGIPSGIYGGELIDSWKIKRNEKVGGKIRIGLDSPVTWPPDPDIPRIAAGVKDRMNRLKCLGNAVVPAQFYPFFAAIAEVEKMERKNG